MPVGGTFVKLSSPASCKTFCVLGAKFVGSAGRGKDVSDKRLGHGRSTEQGLFLLIFFIFFTVVDLSSTSYAFPLPHIFLIVSLVFSAVSFVLNS